MLLMALFIHMQVYVHLSVKNADGKVLDTTRKDEDGSGVPLVFVIGKGKRAPRGWELAVGGAAHFDI